MKRYSYDIDGVQVMLDVQAPHGGPRDYAAQAEQVLLRARYHHDTAAEVMGKRLAMVWATVDEKNQLREGAVEFRPKEVR
mgnify:CR=1 FL=1